jgi:hypothetical protein
MRKIILRIKDSRRKAAFELIRQDTNTEVVKVLTEDSKIGVDAEYEWVRFRNPESESWYEKPRKLTKRQIDGKKVYCDIVTFILDNGMVKKIIFDISSFFGKDGRKREKYTGSEYLDAAAVTAKFNSLVSKYTENNENTEFDEADYIANSDKYIAEKKSRHNEYLAKLEKFAEKYPEIQDFLMKYAKELTVSINEHDTLEEAKIHLRQAKRLMKDNPYNEKFTVYYGWALLYFANFSRWVPPFVDIQGMEETIEMIRELWDKNQTVYELLDVYSMGLLDLFNRCRSVKEKYWYATTAKKMAKTYLSCDIIKNCVSMFIELIETTNGKRRQKYEFELQTFISRYPFSLTAYPFLRFDEYIVDKKGLIMDNIDLFHKKPYNTSIRNAISDALGFYFSNYKNRDVLNSLPVVYIFGLTNCGMSVNVIKDCCKIIRTYLSENPQNIDMARTFANMLAWNILSLSYNDFTHRFTVTNLRVFCGELKKLFGQYPDIPVIAQRYAEGLHNCFAIYTSKRDKIQCRKALAELTRIYPDSEVIKNCSQEVPVPEFVK